MARVVTSTLYDALKAEGFELPEECVDVELRIAPDNVPRLCFVTNLYGERLVQFGRALAHMGRSQAPAKDATLESVLRAVEQLVRNSPGCEISLENVTREKENGDGFEQTGETLVRIRRVQL